jgi:hypothetical protein
LVIVVVGVTPGLGTSLVPGVSGVSAVTPMEEGVGPFCGKRGVVLALGGAPVEGGAEGRAGSDPEGGFVTLGIGLVTAVAQAGAEVAGSSI